MVVIEVHLNGRLLCVAGAEDLSVLSADVCAVGKLGVLSHGAKGPKKPDLRLRVGGLTSRTADLNDMSQDEHLDWVRHKLLSAGDEVTIRVLDSATANKPKRRTPVNPKRNRVNLKQQFEFAKKYYFENRSKYEKRPKLR